MDPDESLRAMYGLPTFSTTPQQGFQIALDGVALPEILNQLVATVKEQAHKLEQLKQNTENALTQRVSDVEMRVARLEGDLELQSRPRYGARVKGSLAGHANISKHVDVVDTRLARLEAYRKVGQSKTLEEINRVANIRYWFRPWALNTKLRMNMDHLNTGNATRVYRRFLGKWKRFLELRAKQCGMQRHCRALLYATTKGALHKFFDRWHHYHVALVNNKEQRLVTLEHAARTISTISNRAVVRAAFQKWIRVVQLQEATCAKIESAGKLENLTHRGICRNYFFKWMSVEAGNEGRRRQRSIVYAMSRMALDNLGKQKLHLWRAYALRKKARRQGISLMPHYGLLAIKDLLRRYFAKLASHNRYKQRLRERVEIDAMWTELRRRCDGLAGQVDVGLKAQSNSNSVIAQLVERVLLVEQAQQGAGPGL